MPETNEKPHTGLSFTALQQSVPGVLVVDYKRQRLQSIFEKQLSQMSNRSFSVIDILSM